MDPSFFILLGAIMVAAFVQRLVGFGFGLIGAPIAMTLFTPFEVTFFMAYWGLATSGPTVFLTRGSIDWSLVRKTLGWVVLGVGLGYVGLIVLPGAIFKTLAMILCVQAFISVFWPALATRGVAWTATGPIAGTTAGVLQATTGVPGPPLIVFLNTLRVSREVFVAVLAVIFLAAAGVRIVVGLGFVAASPYVQVAADLIPDSILYFLVLGSAASTLGVILAQMVESRVSLALFRQIAALLIAGSALTLLLNLIGVSVLG